MGLCFGFFVRSKAGYYINGTKLPFYAALTFHLVLIAGGPDGHVVEGRRSTPGRHGHDLARLPVLAEVAHLGGLRGRLLVNHLELLPGPDGCRQLLAVQLLLALE